jgi:hypothetical protein
VNVNLLIDSIVRQTTVLIAQLATASGGRPSLAHTANQVFIDLVRELKDQGVGSKVIADMFGLALRTYHDRVIIALRNTLVSNLVARSLARRVQRTLVCSLLVIDSFCSRVRR